MKLIIKKQPGVRGLIGTTYAVFNDDGIILKIFMTKREAEDFTNSYSST